MPLLAELTAEKRRGMVVGSRLATSVNGLLCRRVESVGFLMSSFIDLTLWALTAIINTCDAEIL